MVCDGSEEVGVSVMCGRLAAGERYIGQGREKERVGSFFERSFSVRFAV